MFFVSKAKRQIQKTPTSTGGEMNVVLVSYVQTPTEIGELRLRTSLPVKTPE